MLFSHAKYIIFSSDWFFILRVSYFRIALKVMENFDIGGLIFSQFLPDVKQFTLYA